MDDLSRAGSHPYELSNAIIIPSGLSPHIAGAPVGTRGGQTS